MEVGRIVHSIAGHDKGRFYVVVSVTCDRVLIADGKMRKLASPKAKNPLHVRPTAAVVDLAVVTTDKKLRNALQPWNAKGKEGGY